MFWIDGQEFPVETAELVAEIDESSRRIALSLYVECAEGETGMSLNNISVPGAAVAGLIARLSEDARDDFNDLSQSEASLRGVTMRVRSFFLRLGSPRGDKISVEFTASCYPFDASTEKATGKDQNLKFSGEVDLSLESGRI